MTAFMLEHEREIQQQQQRQMEPFARKFALQFQFQCVKKRKAKKTTAVDLFDSLVIYSL